MLLQANLIKKDLVRHLLVTRFIAPGPMERLSSLMSSLQFHTALSLGLLIAESLQQLHMGSFHFGIAEWPRTVSNRHHRCQSCTFLLQICCRSFLTHYNFYRNSNILTIEFHHTLNYLLLYHTSGGEICLWNTDRGSHQTICNRMDTDHLCWLKNPQENKIVASVKGKVKI